jgi:CRP/FNR family transcriptional regulator, cyclic AMP receptor protein
MAQDAYIKTLSNMTLFADCSKRELQTIATNTDEVEVDAGYVLMKQGENGQEAFVILRGTASVMRDGQKIATLSRGAIFGELSLLDPGKRTATVVADTDMDLLVLTGRGLQLTMKAAPAIAVKMLRNLAARLREYEDHAH